MDGRSWRTVPDAVVVSCGLAAGVELGRPLLRRLRAELRQAQALAAAGRVLRRRDLSRHALDARLARAGVASGPRQRAVAALAEAGAVDDQRLAERRAASLAKRGWSDEAIRARLEAEGVGAEERELALEQLPPELERAARLVEEAQDARRAWRLLLRRGFDAETSAKAVAALDEGEPGGLG